MAEPSGGNRDNQARVDIDLTGMREVVRDLREAAQLLNQINGTQGGGRGASSASSASSSSTSAAYMYDAHGGVRGVSPGRPGEARPQSGPTPTSSSPFTSGSPLGGADDSAWHGMGPLDARFREQLNAQDSASRSGIGSMNDPGAHDPSRHQMGSPIRIPGTNFTVPGFSQLPFGETTTQMKLEGVANAFGGRRNERGEFERGGMRGQAASMAMSAAGLAAYATGARHFLSNKQSDLMMYSDLQTQLGQEAFQETIPGTDIGFRSNIPFLSDAGTEALKFKAQEYRLRMMAGVNEEEAQSMITGLGQSGWAGDDFDMMLNEGLAPAFKQSRVNPELLTPMLDQTMRQGNGSFREFVNIMSQVPAAADAANMSVDEFAQGMDEFAQATQERGGTYQQGMRAATDISTATGQSPQVANQVVSNPIVQSINTMQTGIMPWEQGLLSPGDQMTGGYETVKMLMNATPDYALPEYAGRVNPITGERDHVSTEDRKLALVAEMSGMPLEAVKNMWKNGDQAQKSMEALDVLGQVGRRENRRGAREDARKRNKETLEDLRAQLGDEGNALIQPDRARSGRAPGKASRTGPGREQMNTDGLEDMTVEELNRLASGEEVDGMTVRANKRDEMRDYARKIGRQTRLAGSGGGAEAIAEAMKTGKSAAEDRKLIKKALQHAGVEGDALKSITEEGDIGKMRARAARAIGRRSENEKRKNSLDVNIRLRGEAKSLLKTDKSTHRLDIGEILDRNVFDGGGLLDTVGQAIDPMGIDPFGG